jgi:hypothetical protein
MNLISEVEKSEKTQTYRPPVCEFHNVCPDIQKLRESYIKGVPNEELIEQQDAVCTGLIENRGRYCIQYKEFANKGGKAICQQ